MIGETVGNFQVIRRLGEGGMGEVLLGQHKDIRTNVAIKVLRSHISADKQHVQRFFNEAVAVGKIKHAGIVKIFDVGFHTRGEAYLVMELLEGESLASRIARAGRLPIDQSADIARQIASVLEATHTAGITHRDLKPDNVFLVPDTELASGERVKVLDFGIAKLGASGMTRTGGPMGTPTYMPPEQWKNTATVDGRADLYALGCLVFEMVCGRPPFVSESMAELCNMHLHEPPPPPGTLAEMPPQLGDLLLRLIAKNPDDRPSLREAKAMFSQFANDFRGVAAQTLLPDGSFRELPVAALGTNSPRTPPTTLGRGAMPLVTAAPKRSRWPVFTGLGVLVAGGLLAVLARRTAEPEPEPAPTTIAAPLPAEVPAPVPGASTTTRMQIETSPVDATITIDDAQVANPFDGKFARDGMRRRVDVRAPGYKPMARWVAFDSEQQTLVITLDKELAAVRPSKPARPPKPMASAKATTPEPQPEPVKVEPVVREPAKSTGYKGTKGKIMTEYPPN